MDILKTMKDLGWDIRYLEPRLWWLSWYERNYLYIYGLHYPRYQKLFWVNWKDVCSFIENDRWKIAFQETMTLKLDVWKRMMYYAKYWCHHATFDQIHSYLLHSISIFVPYWIPSFKKFETDFYYENIFKYFFSYLLSRSKNINDFDLWNWHISELKNLCFS